MLINVLTRLTPRKAFHLRNAFLGPLYTPGLLTCHTAKHHWPEPSWPPSPPLPLLWPSIFQVSFGTLRDARSLSLSLFLLILFPLRIPSPYILQRHRAILSTEWRPCRRARNRAGSHLPFSFFLGGLIQPNMEKNTKTKQPAT